MTLGRLGYDERSFISAAAFSSDGGRDSPRKLYEIVVHYFSLVLWESGRQLCRCHCSFERFSHATVPFMLEMLYLRGTEN